jgi:2-dehydropantoate 2-reductase
MKFLVVGAGATGGYFGGRLLEAGRDVTFLVRPARRARLAQAGLSILSPAGNYHHPHPPLVGTDELDARYDLVLVSCKAYDLDGAIESFSPAVGPATAVLPLLNGLRHLDVLEARFGAGAVLGGLCVISAGLDAEGRIQHFNDAHALSFGERAGGTSARTAALAEACADARFEARASVSILQEMWDKWVFIAALAGITCLMRAPVGDIVAAGAAELAVALLDECAAIAAAAGQPLRAPLRDRYVAMLTAPGSAFSASMLRDIERGGPSEGAHVLGDLLRRAPTPGPLLRTAAAHLATYEARRARQATPAAR